LHIKTPNNIKEILGGSMNLAKVIPYDLIVATENEDDFIEENFPIQ